MKYLIEDSEDHTYGEIRKYFKEELIKTNLIKAHIKVSKKLQEKLAMIEICDIFDDNDFSEMNVSGRLIELNKSGHNIEVSKKEIKERFDNYFNSELYDLINK